MGVTSGVVLDPAKVQVARQKGAAGTFLCHALDRPDLQFTVGRLMSTTTKPQRKHQAVMKHCLRYTVGRRCCAWKFDYLKWPGEIVILTDADWASDSERRRSVDCVHIYHGGHLIEAASSTQQVVSLSAESEFYGIVRGAASGVQLREAYMQFGFSVRLRVLSDSSAGCDCKDWQRSDEACGGSIPLGARPRQEETVLGGEHRHIPQHGGERLQELMRMMPIVIGEFEPTKLPKKWLGGLFLASQVTQVQGNDESTAVMQYKEKYEEVLVCRFGFVSGVLVMALVRFVADNMFGGRCR